MRISSKIMAAILAILMVLIQVPTMCGYSLENAMDSSTVTASSKFLNESDLYYDYKKDTKAQAARENSAGVDERPGETRIRASSIDKVLPEDSLPSSLNISTSKHIPPINNQRTIGSCQSMSLAYMQMSNAISRYIELNNIDDTWNPKLNKENRFTPKWSCNFVGGYADDVYTVLYQNGVMTTDKNDYFVNYSYETDEDHAWDFTGAYDALTYRLKGEDSYDAYHMTQMTTSSKGKELMKTIKSALLKGNVVELNGYFDDVIYGIITGAGEIGKRGERAIVASAGKKTGGHSMSIVGYDDNIEATYNDVTLKGAFLIANSHGTSYCNKGFVWVMYDSLNTKSEHDGLNNASIYESPMNITIDDDLSVYSPSNYAESSNWSFENAGKATVNGKSYTAYNIGRFNYIDGSVGPYISYTDDKSDNVVLTNYVTEYSRWCLIPYEDIIKWSSFDKSNFSEEHLGTYWLYAVDKDSTAPVFLNSGIDKETEGNDLKLSKFAKGLPETKSFSLPYMFENSSNNFTTKIIVDETKPEAANRHEAFDDYHITYWDSDYIVEKPDLILGITIQAYDKYDCKIKPFNNRIIREFYTPIMYQSLTHKKYEGCAFSGKPVSELTAPETVTMYFNLDELALYSDKTYTDYEWGAKVICDSESGHSVTVTAVEIISGRDGRTLAGGEFASPVTIKNGKSKLFEYKLTEYSKFDKKEKPVVSATSDENNITVSWTKVKNVSGYKVYRKVADDSKWKLVKNCETGLTTSYVDKTCEVNVIYQYKVIPYSEVYGNVTDGAESDPTEPIERVFIGGTQIIDMREVETGIQLTWTKAKFAMNYDIYRRTPDVQSWTLVKTVGDILTTIDDTVPRDKEYYYMVWPTYVRASDGAKINGGSDVSELPAYLHSHSNEQFKVNNAVTLKVGARTVTSNKIPNENAELVYKVLAVNEHFLKLCIKVDKELMNELGANYATEFLTIYGLTNDDLPTFVETINNGENAILSFDISSACCVKVAEEYIDTNIDSEVDSDTDSELNTDTHTDSDSDSDSETDSDHTITVGDKVYLSDGAINMDAGIIDNIINDLDYQVFMINKGNIATLMLNVSNDFLKNLNMDLEELLIALGYSEPQADDSKINYHSLLEQLNEGKEVTILFNVDCSQLLLRQEDITVYGDANCDGKIDMVDVTTIQKILAKLLSYENYGENSESNCDCNRDGKVTMEDVTLLQRFLAKLVDEL